MYCDCCRANDPKDKGTFVTGSQNFKVESLKYHELSAGHKLNADKLKAKEAAPGSSSAEKSIEALNKVNFDRLCKLFRNAHGLAKQGRPYSDFMYQCDLDQMKGFDMGQTYRNRKSAQVFIHYIAEHQRSLLCNIVKKAKFLSIISDGATESSRLEAEILYTRVCDHGILSTHFTSITNIGKANAENIAHVLSSAMTEAFSEEWKMKIVGIATDGAAVMRGKTTGVVTRLVEETNRPFIQTVHCSAHRLELAFKDAIKELPLWKRTEALLLGVYLFYRRSPLNRSNLIVSFEMEDMAVLIPSRVGGTRWVGHVARALKNLLTSYRPLVEHLKQMQNPDDPCHSHKTEGAQKAKNFLKSLTDKSVLHFLFFLWDIVVCLTTVSESFQRHYVTLGDVYIEVELGKKTISGYRENDGPKLRQLTATSNPDIQYKDHVLSGNLKRFDSARVQLIDKLTQSLSDRFVVDSQLSEACCITNMNIWPPILKEGFGDEHIAVLVTKFQPALEAAGVDAWQVEPEWVRLKDTICRLYPERPADLTWALLNSQLKGDCSNILSLVDLVLTLPASSAEAERGFSAMKLVKSDWRSRLKDNHRTCL